MTAATLLPESSTVLLVEDTPANLALVAGRLEEEGMRVLVAGDGEEALARVRYATPDLVLLDVILPGIDGFEVCRRLKADPATRDIPVIFMTALGNTEDKVAAFQAGAVDYVTKPFEIAEILARVRTHLALHVLQRRLARHARQLEHEVAERSRAEAELLAANAELDSFAHAVSHDLRGPLRRIGGCAQILAANCGERLGESREFLDQIVAGSREMGDLIEALLQLSRSTRGEIERQAVDLAAMAERIRRDLEQSAPSRRVAWEIAPGLAATGDVRLLEVVMRNLLDNAWKYTAATAEPEIRVYGEQADGKAWYCVADNGAGFDMRQAGQLFKPFRRLHRESEFPGIGIGLATVQRVVLRHGGEIEVSAAPGKGATFRFTLPPAGGDAAAGETPADTPPA